MTAWKLWCKEFRGECSVIIIMICYSVSRCG